MVYIDNQGRVLEAKPWGINSIGDFFWGIINFFSLFFRTLINPDANKKGDGYATDYRSRIIASHARATKMALGMSSCLAAVNY